MELGKRPENATGKTAFLPQCLCLCVEVGCPLII